MSDTSSNICVVLATFNVARYLSAQLDSLLIQTNNEWNLLVSDDDSLDDTIEVIKSYSERYEKVQLLSNKNGPVESACANFYFLLDRA